MLYYEEEKKDNKEHKSEMHELSIDETCKVSGGSHMSYSEEPAFEWEPPWWLI